MRVIIERSNLLKSLNHVHRVVERRNTIPILSNALLTAEGASLEMKATDLDLEMNEATPARVEQAGSTTVPAHLLYDIVRKLPDGAEVMLKVDEGGAAMSVISGDLVPPAMPASIRLSGTIERYVSAYFPAGSRGAQRACRENAVCNLDRRNTLLSQRHLFPYA